MYSLDDTASAFSDTTDEAVLKSLIEEHYKETASEVAKQLLDDWQSAKTKFKKIIPRDYLRIKSEIRTQKAAGLSEEDALLAAFKKVTA